MTPRAAVSSIKATCMPNVMATDLWLTHTHTHVRNPAVTLRRLKKTQNVHTQILCYSLLSLHSLSISAFVRHTFGSYKCCLEVRARRPCLFNGPSVCQLFLWGGQCVGRRSRDLGGRADAAGSDRWRGVRLHSFNSMRTTEPHFKQQERNLLAPSSAMHRHAHAATHAHTHMLLLKLS